MHQSKKWWLVVFIFDHDNRIMSRAFTSSVFISVAFAMLGALVHLESLWICLGYQKSAIPAVNGEYDPQQEGFTPAPFRLQA
jgi:hypothetical protein